MSSPTPEELDKHWVIRYRWTLRRGVRTAVMIFSFVITMLIAIALHFLLPSTPANFASTLMGVDSCRTETEFFIIADSILCLLGMPVWLVLLWNVKDSYQLKVTRALFFTCARALTTSEFRWSSNWLLASARRSLFSGRSTS